MSKQPEVSNSGPKQEESQFDFDLRYLPFVFLLLLAILLFIGGVAAGIYYLFSKYSGIQNIWLLICFTPIVLILFVIFIVSNLYTRYGKPLRQIMNAIDSVGKGDLSVRVPGDSSPQFEGLIKRFNKMVSELARADQQRRNLTADIAHELRTPLHIIQGKLEGILDGVYEPTPQQINEALDETKFLGRLVNDLQILSMAEAGQLPLNKTRFLLADLIQDVKSSFAAQADGAGIDLGSNVTDPRQEISADYGRLNQVLSNLVSNSLRYTPKGGKISLETETIGVAGKVRIRVTDTGEGIPAEDLPFIFDRFWKGEKSRTRDGQGSSGLGLAIARHLVQAHGGTIDVESEVGKGTKFVIQLPE